MDSKIILGRILQKFIDKGYSQVEGYNRFQFVELRPNSVLVLRENKNSVLIPFKTLLKIIDEYKLNPDHYDQGPSQTRDYGIIHINSPSWSIIHLMEKDVFFSK